MPDPNGDGHGSPISNVGSIALAQTAALASEAGQGHGETGIIIVGGDAAVPDTGSFWDQAVAHIGAANGGMNADALSSSTIHTSAIENILTPVHQASTQAADTHLATFDPGHSIDAGHATLGAAHEDLSSMAHFELPSLSVAQIGHQMFG
jgi:hypothetical protein